MSITPIFKAMSSLLKGIGINGSRTDAEQSMVISNQLNADKWPVSRDAAPDNRIIVITALASPIVLIYDERSRMYRLA